MCLLASFSCVCYWKRSASPPPPVSSLLVTDRVSGFVVFQFASSSFLLLFILQGIHHVFEGPRGYLRGPREVPGCRGRLRFWMCPGGVLEHHQSFFCREVGLSTVYWNIDGFSCGLFCEAVGGYWIIPFVVFSNMLFLRNSEVSMLWKGCGCSTNLICHLQISITSWCRTHDFGRCMLRPRLINVDGTPSRFWAILLFENCFEIQSLPDITYSWKGARTHL